jgi:hypothetical protein
MISVFFPLTQIAELLAFGSVVISLQYLASWKDRKRLKLIAHFYKELSEE